MPGTGATCRCGAVPWFFLKTLGVWGFLIWERIGIARDVGGGPKQDANFTVNGASAVGVDIDTAQLMDICLAENDRRLGGYDQRLLPADHRADAGAFRAALHAQQGSQPRRSGLKPRPGEARIGKSAERVTRLHTRNR